MNLAELIFVIVIFLLSFDFLLTRILTFLNNGQWKKPLPKELESLYSANDYDKAKNYAGDNYKLSLIKAIASFVLIISIFSFGGLSFIDKIVFSLVGDHPIYSALLFFGIIGLISWVLGLPFSIYSTFIIEEKYGFNKTTVRTFIADTIKSILLSVIIGGGIGALIVKLFMIFGEDFWIYTWIVLSLFMILLTMFYSSLIVPLFNKQTPLEEGELRDALEAFGNKVGFELDNIYVIDGSKRSTKANAYFSGLGAKKRIVLYDTLINDCSVDEIVAVLAHEVGHYKRKHTLSGIIISLVQSAVMLYVLSLFINPDAVIAKATAEAFQARQTFHLGVIVFGVLYSPISEVIGIFMNMLSRKNEYEADAYAKEYSSGENLSSALIKLTKNNLGNLNPHPAFVFINYSHPPLLFRLRKLS